MKKNFIGIVAVLVGLNTSTPSYAQFWKKAGDVVSGGLNIVKQTVTAPTQVVVNAANAVVNHGSASDIYKPIVDLAKTTGNTAVNAAQVINAPQVILTQQAQQFASRVGGKPGEFIFDISTFMQQYTANLAVSGVQVANNVLNGQNPFEIAGAPLAAAIHAARDRFAPTARPIPDDVKSALQPYFDQGVLNRARYAIGSVEITLPNLIIQGRRVFGMDDYAVTVDDIIVFPKDPGGYSQSCEWWAHELTHVRQYGQWGVEQFAYNYVRDHNGVENEAIENARVITNGNWCFSQQQQAEFIQVVNQRELAASTNSSNNSIQGYIPSTLNFNESYVAQCILPDNPLGAMFLVTNQSRIIAVNPSTGQSMHVGYANPPRLQNVAWSFDLPNQGWRFAVGFNGIIYYLTGPIYNYGQLVGYQNWQNIGFVRTL